MMTRVCHVSSVHRPFDTRIFFKECTSLAKAGYDVTYVVHGESQTCDGIKIAGIGTPRTSRLYRFLFFSYKAYKRALEQNAEIYHLHDPELLLWALLLKLRKKIVIFDSHEDVPGQILAKTYIPVFLRRIVSFTYTIFERFVLSRLDAVISVTPHQHNRLKRINERTVMVTNFPRVLPLNPKIVHMAKAVCFAGGISPEWNHDVIVSVLDKLDSETIYKLYGDFESIDYRNLLESLNGWSHVFYGGRIAHENVHTCLQECSLGIALCKKSFNTAGDYGTLGNTKLFEYMMAGLPILCTDFVLWKEIVEKNHIGICVNPTDVDAVAEALRNLFRDPMKLTAMGMRARELAEKTYNWSSEEKKLIDLYRELSG